MSDKRPAGADALLYRIQKSILPHGMVRRLWAADEKNRAEDVALFRRYFDGDFDANMTREMREALRIAKGREVGANQCELIVNTMTDRLELKGIEGASDRATAWLAEAVLQPNRLDAFQIDVMQDVLIDGESFVMVDWDNERGGVRWTHEKAYDGEEGVIGIGMRGGWCDMAAKVWRESRERFADTIRVNVYAPDAILRYVDYGDGQGFVELPDDAGGAILPWVTAAGQPLGVPLIPFANKADKHGRGRSEIAGVIAMQDARNRTLHSTLAVAETLGFPIRTAIGWKPDARIVPGQIIVATPTDDNNAMKDPTPDEIEWMKAIRFGQFDTADLAPLLNLDSRLEGQINKVTATPDDSLSADASGEARKQAEVSLLGKVKRFQIKIGNAWENCAAMSVRVQDAFGPPPVDSPTWRARWRDAALRSEAQVIVEAVKLEPLIGLRAALELVGTVLDYDAAQIARIIADREANQQALTDAVFRNMPALNGRSEAVGDDA